MTGFESVGLRTRMIDVGVLGSPPFAADISQLEVAAAATEDLAALQKERDRRRSVTAMVLGPTAILGRLFAQGTIHGVVALGESAGTTIATAAMRALPNAGRGRPPFNLTIVSGKFPVTSPCS